MEESFSQIMNNLKEMYEYEYHRLMPVVNDIISNRITNINIIETVLDKLLCCYYDKCIELFLKLCNYYFTVNEEYANEYMEFFKENYIDENEYDKMCR